MYWQSKRFLRLVVSWSCLFTTLKINKRKTNMADFWQWIRQMWVKPFGGITLFRSVRRKDSERTHLMAPVSPWRCVSTWALISASWLVERSHLQQCSENKPRSHWRCSIMWPWKRACLSVSKPHTWHLKEETNTEEFEETSMETELALCVTVYFVQMMQYFYDF